MKLDPNLLFFYIVICSWKHDSCSFNTKYYNNIQLYRTHQNKTISFYIQSNVAYDDAL